MAFSAADVKNLREMTGVGMMDCKKALTAADGDIDKAVEWLREKGLAAAQKKAGRIAAEGMAYAAVVDSIGVIVEVNAESDFVAKNATFVELTKKLLALALENKVKSIDELKALTIDGRTVAELVVEESGKTGEKTEISAYEYLEGASVTSYNHFGNKLSTIVSFNLEGVDAQVMRDVAMQVAAMNPVAVNREAVPQHIVDSELSVAVEKTKEELVKKAVDAALHKAGINPNLVDSEDHIESNMAKGWLTQEEADKARKISKETAEAKAANLPEAMIKNIANGRLNKFFKESCLLEQEYVKDGKLSVGQYLEASSKGLVAVAFKRVNLNED